MDKLLIKCKFHMKNSEKLGNKLFQSAMNRLFNDFWTVDGFISKKWKERYLSLNNEQVKELELIVVDILVDKWSNMAYRKGVSTTIRSYFG